MKTIKIQDDIKTWDGRRARLPKRDEDGDVVWVDKTKAEPELIYVDTVYLIRTLFFALPQKLQAPKDPIAAVRLWDQVEASKQRGDGTITLHEDEYEWLHRVLKRPYPLSREEKDMDLPQRTIAQFVWGLDAEVFTRALTDIDAQAPESPGDTPRKPQKA